MSEETLFELPAKEKSPAPATSVPGRPGCCARCGISLTYGGSGIDLLPQEHPARSIWSFLETLDLSAHEPIKAVENRPGRPTTDTPRCSGVVAAGHG